MIEYDRDSTTARYTIIGTTLRLGVAIGLERLRQQKIDAQAKGFTVIEVVQFALTAILSDHDMTCHEVQNIIELLSVIAKYLGIMTQ